MSIVAMDVPAQSRTRKARFSAEDVASAVKLVKAGKTATLGESFEDRSSAQVAGYYLREAVASEMGVPAKGNIRSRTWEQDGKFRASVQQAVPADGAATKR